MSELIKTKAEVLAAASELFGVAEVNDRWHPEVHALTDAQFNRAQAKMLDGQSLVTSAKDIAAGTAGDSVSMNLGGLVEGEFAARVYACSQGLVEEWTEEEVRSIPFPGAVEIISDKIFELGGHNLFEGLDKGVRRRVSQFRPDGRRARDRRASADGHPSGQQPDGDDDSSEGVSEGGHDTGLAAASGE